jgi:hypothetical protein
MGLEPCFQPHPFNTPFASCACFPLPCRPRALSLFLHGAAYEVPRPFFQYPSPTTAARIDIQHAEQLFMTRVKMKEGQSTMAPKNRDPLAPWNNALYKDSPFAPHNSAIDKDSPFKPWNKAIWSKDDLTPEEKKFYNIQD